MNSYLNRNKIHIRCLGFSQIAEIWVEDDFSDFMKIREKSAISHDFMYTPDRKITGRGSN